MRSGFIIVLIASLIFMGGYFFYVAEAVCPIPLEYSIGKIDPRFKISFEDARVAAANAESLWEDATGKNLFTYNENASFPIHFVFDERQEDTNTERELRTELEDRKDLSESVRNEYKNLVREYENIKSAYESQSISYDQRLAEHNSEVVSWNEKGGAPENVYEELSARQTALAREQQELNVTAGALNQIVHKINTISDKGNEIVGVYNDVVETYNKNFDGERDFTQGDYQGTFINIYQFSNKEELQLVMAHEFGHALSLGHVKNNKSIMFHFMSEQNSASGITSEDMDEFIRACGDPTAASYITFLQKLLTQLRSVVST